MGHFKDHQDNNKELKGMKHQLTEMDHDYDVMLRERIESKKQLAFTAPEMRLYRTAIWADDVVGDTHGWLGSGGLSGADKRSSVALDWAPFGIGCVP